MVTGFELATAAAIVFVAAAVQGSLGFGFAILSVPTLTLADPGLAPVPVELLSFPIAAMSLRRERGAADRSGVAWIVAARVPGALAGAWLLSIASERVISIVIGVIVLSALPVLASGFTVPLNAPNRILAGVVSGFSSAASAIGGPPLAMLYSGRRGPQVRSTLGAVFAIGTVVNIGAYFIAGVLGPDEMTAALALAPAMVGGYLVSSRVKHLADGAVIRAGILVLSGVAASTLLVKAI